MEAQRICLDTTFLIDLLRNLPAAVVAGLYEASVRFEQVIETTEVLLDKKTMQRIRLGKKEYRKRAYVLARDAEEIRKVLSS
jgi:uncharacterized protein YhaN